MCGAFEWKRDNYFPTSFKLFIAYSGIKLSSQISSLFVDLFHIFSSNDIIQSLPHNCSNWVWVQNFGDLMIKDTCKTYAKIFLIHATHTHIHACIWGNTLVLLITKHVRKLFFLASLFVLLLTDSVSCFDLQVIDENVMRKVLYDVIDNSCVSCS